MKYLGESKLKLTTFFWKESKKDELMDGSRDKQISVIKHNKMLILESRGWGHECSLKFSLCETSQ